MNLGRHNLYARPTLAALLVLTGCAASPGLGGTPSAFVWFASLAFMGLAGAAFALGRLTERKARAAELFEARSQQAALWSAVGDALWRTDAQLQWAGGDNGSAPPPWFSHPGLQQLLAARRSFQRLHVAAAREGAGAAAREGAGSAAPSSVAAAWCLSAQPLLDHQGQFAGYVGTARALDGEAAAAQAALAPTAQVHTALVHTAQVPDTAPAAGAATTVTATAPLGETAPITSTSPAPTAAPTVAPTAAENEEADSFSLTVAHDLRAPIRVVDGFTRIVKEDYGHLLDRVANDHLERVLSAAARMNKMIDALLTLARLSNQPLTRQPVNLSQIAHYVMDELQRAQPGREVDLSIEPGLQVMGDPTLLRLVLENLLGNAWKYSGRTAKAQISLTTVRHGSGRAFVVRDNGAGFDMRSAERLFGVFQRLHSASEFAGHGVGLASARRIVRRHGGDIWAEAEPARGASFTFTLAEN